MEGWGRGIPDIFVFCKEAGLPEPKFDFVSNYVCLTIRFKSPLKPYVSWDFIKGVNGVADGHANGLVNGPVNTLGGSLKDVYIIVLKNPGIKIRQIAEKRRRSESTVKKQLTKLRKMNLIEYLGSDKTGGYYPLNK